MPVVSIIGPKGGFVKTTVSINRGAALTRKWVSKRPDNRVCLIDLDLRLPTISSLLDSHPTKSFYDLFETLANRTYQIDFLRIIYQILSRFQWYLDGRLTADDESLERSLGHYKNMNTDLFHFTDFEFGEELFELFLNRGDIHRPTDLKSMEALLQKIDLARFRKILKEHEDNAWPLMADYLKYIEEYGFSILGGEIPILGKRQHRKRINEPEFLLLFLDVLGGVLRKFEYVILDTPAGGVNHLSSLMNVIDQIFFVFDLSNKIAVNGSIDALHSFIDYYEEFYEDFQQGRLMGLDKAYVQRLIAERGEEAVRDSMTNKDMCILFNRYQDSKEIINSVQKLREYLDTLDKLRTYKDRIRIVGMLPHHKVINITNNRGVLFYQKDRMLTEHMDQVAENIIQDNLKCPTLSNSNEEILQYLKTQSWWNLSGKLGRIASLT